MSAAGILTRFSSDFGVPFLMGARCVIGDPLGARGFAAVKHGLDIDVALKDACDAQFVEAALFADITPAPFDHDAATMLYAAHELFATTHPQTSSFYARAHLFARAAATEVEALPRTLDPGRLLTRHLIARRMFRTTRTDVHLKWWTGNASFYGEEPSWRLTQWPSLRRVHQQRLTQPMWRLALAGDDPELRTARQALLVSVLDASPLTRLLFAGDPVTKNLGFSLLLPSKIEGRRVSILDLLDDRALARAVVDSLLKDGLDVGGSALALALLQGLREGTSPLVLRRAAELCTHLALMACHIEGEAPGALESRPLVAFIDGDPAAINEASRVYWAVVAATLALGRAGTFAVPVPTSLTAIPAERDVFARLVRRLEHKRVVAVAEPLLRELGRRMPKPKATSSSLLESSSSELSDSEAAPESSPSPALESSPSEMDASGDLEAIADIAEDLQVAESRDRGAEAIDVDDLDDLDDIKDADDSKDVDDDGGDRGVERP